MLETIFWGVLAFSILVVIHEGGHFFTARAFGVKVHEFMIGLPGPAIRFKSKRSGTVFGITAIPLGGYVRIAGMEPGAEDELLAPALKAAAMAGRIDAGVLAQELGCEVERASALLATLMDWGVLLPAEDDKISYLSTVSADESTNATALLDQARSVTYRALSKPKRIAVLSMGVLANFATALVVFTVVLSTWGYYQHSLVLDDVQPQSGAAAAGLQSGDRIASIDGQNLNDWFDLTSLVAQQEPGDSIRVTYVRDGAELSTTALLGASGEGAPVLGVISSLQHVDLSVGQSVVESFRMTGLVFQAIGGFFSPETFQQSVEGARGIVGITVEVAEAAERGPLDFAFIIALLSLSLGAMNILPIPPLDGGKIVIEIFEGIARREVGRRFSIATSLVGFTLLLSLVGYLIYADIVRYFINP